MSNFESTIIPLEDCHTLLASFGIDGDNREYQRWRRDKGFRWVDLEDVLNTSRFVLNVDWREWLQDATDIIANQLAGIGTDLSTELNEEGDRGVISIGDAASQIKYVPSDNDDFCLVVASVNSLLNRRASYRKFNSCVGSDGYLFGLQTTEQWNELDLAIPKTINLIFASDLP